MPLKYATILYINKDKGYLYSSLVLVLASVTIDPRRPFKWLEFCVASRTVGFTLQFQKH